MKNDFTRVEIIEDAKAQGDAVQVFQNFMDKQGKVPEWARVMANRPEILAVFAKLVGITMGPGLVEQDNKWKMAYKVSKLNNCQYCIGVTEGMMKKLGVSEEDMQYVLTDISKMKPDEKVAVEYAEAVTKDAVNLSDQLFEELKKSYNEAQIVELTAVIGLFNYINRFNDALRVVPE